jgi:glyoxylate reductase
VNERANVYVTRRVPAGVRAELEASFDVTVNDHDTPQSRRDLLRAVSGYHGVVVMLSDKVDEEFLQSAGPTLRIVANYAVGFDNVDIEACTRHGVIATNTPDVLTEATAELTLALLLTLARRVSEGDRLLRAERPWVWSPTFMLGDSLRGRLLGIIGLGRIGREVARLAEAFGMRVVYTSLSGRSTDEWEHVSLDDLVQSADVLSLHCPLTEQTHHLINRDVLRAMKPTSYLVNTARGPIVDEEALAEALRRREIAGAALDVFEREPEVTQQLLDLDNVVLAPHLGSATRDTRDAMGRLCVSALRTVLVEHQVPKNALNPRR